MYRETYEHPEAGEIVALELTNGYWWCAGIIAASADEAFQLFSNRWNSTVTNWDGPPYDAATATGMYDKDF